MTLLAAHYGAATGLQQTIASLTSHELHAGQACNVLNCLPCLLTLPIALMLVPLVLLLKTGGKT